jgi:hypothetical protein
VDTLGGVISISSAQAIICYGQHQIQNLLLHKFLVFNELPQVKPVVVKNATARQRLQAEGKGTIQVTLLKIGSYDLEGGCAMDQATEELFERDIAELDYFAKIDPLATGSFDLQDEGSRLRAKGDSPREKIRTLVGERKGLYIADIDEFQGLLLTSDEKAHFLKKKRKVGGREAGIDPKEIK